MSKKLSKEWLKEYISRNGYVFSEEEWSDFFSKLIEQKISTKKMIQETFEEDDISTVSIFISSKILSTIIFALQKYYSKYFSSDDFKKLVLASILQYEKIHCCVINSENILDLIGKNVTFVKEMPYQMLIVSSAGLVRYSDDKFKEATLCKI